jgi:hypothetical protein
MEPFALDEEATREWLTRLMVACELGDLAPDDGADIQVRPCIDLAWRPRTPGQEDAVSWLIGQAQSQVGVLSHPEETKVTIGFVDDGDDWCYQFFLVVNLPLSLMLAARPQEISRLGSDSAFNGIDAAVAVLREAMQAANALASQLTAFVSAATGKS